MNSAPPNPNSESTDLAKKITFKTKEEREKFAHSYDWKHLIENHAEALQRFEKEIVPLAR